MYDIDGLREIGRSAALALDTQDEWLHRHVESITFPFPDRPIYRRYASVDFTIPRDLRAVETLHSRPLADDPDHADGADEAEDAAAAFAAGRFYVPVALIRKWPPLSRLDLRGVDGRPVPFLTAAQNALIDAAALLALAERICGTAELDATLRSNIALIPSGSLPEGRDALKSLMGTPGEDDVHRVSLQQSETFCGIARSLLEHTLLWIRVDGRPGDRMIIKFSYDMPMETNLQPWSKPAFGLDVLVFRFDAPRAGTNSSYHCNIVAPSPLDVIRAEFTLFDIPKDGSEQKQIGPYVRFVSASTEPAMQSPNVRLFSGIAESQAKFYAGGRRNGLGARLYVAVLVDSELFCRGAMIASGAATALIVAFAALLPQVVSEVEASVAVMVVTPVILGSVLVRPLVHVLAGGFLVGIRRLVIAAGAPGVIAAALVALSQGQEHTWLQVGLAILAGVQLAITLGLAWIIRTGRRIRQKMRPHDDARLVSEGELGVLERAE